MFMAPPIVSWVHGVVSVVFVVVVVVVVALLLLLLFLLLLLLLLLSRMSPLVILDADRLGDVRATLSHS